VKKKRAGETTNGGTYHHIGPQRSGFPVPTGQDMNVAASASNLADASMRLRLFGDNAWVLDVVDSGIGCAPIAAPGRSPSDGQRRREVDDYRVEAVPWAVAVSRTTQGPLASSASRPGRTTHVRTPWVKSLPNGS
jgi:hypothetical protein